MNETLILALAGLAGLALGTLFFGGLWWTVRRGVASKRPELWIFGSMLLRTGIVLGGFYAVSGHRWERLMLCLLGFVTARVAVTQLTRIREDNQTRPAREVRHAT